MTESTVPLELSVEATKEQLDSEQIVLIDCREPNEFEIAKIDGAILMPMSAWQSEAQKLAEFKGRRLVVHCHHGMRSLRVTNWLRENGFPDAQSMAGGIDAWSQNIDATVPVY